MGLGDAAKDLFAEYRQKYLDDRLRFSNSIKLSAGRSEGRISRALYQPYKWLFVFPLLVVTTFIFGIGAVVFALLFSPRIGSVSGVL